VPAWCGLWQTTEHVVTVYSNEPLLARVRIGNDFVSSISVHAYILYWQKVNEKSIKLLLTTQQSTVYTGSKTLRSSDLLRIAYDIEVNDIMLFDMYKHC